MNENISSLIMRAGYMLVENPDLSKIAVVDKNGNKLESYFGNKIYRESYNEVSDGPSYCFKDNSNDIEFSFAVYNKGLIKVNYGDQLYIDTNCDNLYSVILENGKYDGFYITFKRDAFSDMIINLYTRSGPIGYIKLLENGYEVNKEFHTIDNCDLGSIDNEMLSIIEKLLNKELSNELIKYAYKLIKLDLYGKIYDKLTKWQDNLEDYLSISEFAKNCKLEELDELKDQKALCEEEIASCDIKIAQLSNLIKLRDESKGNNK